MPRLAENDEATRRLLLLSLVSRKRSSAQRRRAEAVRFETEADALQAEADEIGRALAARDGAA